jgi:hypothetical protein
MHANAVCGNGAMRDLVHVSSLPRLERMPALIE